MLFTEFIEEVKKRNLTHINETKREQKHNFIEVENEITYGH